MKTLQVKQHSKMALPIGIAYLAAVFLIGYFAFGGIDGMADRVNGMGSPKAAGFIVALVVIAPLLVLLRFVHPVLSITVDAGKMMIRQKGKKEKVVPLQVIDRVEWNISAWNRADFYDRQNRLVACFRDTSDPAALLSLLDEISRHIPFERITGSRKFVNRVIETAVFRRKILND